MKSTGMVRRIDALGRVVIPKEIRKTLKIRDNEALEIFIDDDHVILKKYSAVLEIESTSQQFAEILYKLQNIPVLICDMEKVIAVAGIAKNEIINRPIAHAFFECIINLKSYAYKDNTDKYIYPIENDKRYVIASTPIARDGNVYGAIMFLSKDINSTKIATDVEIKLIQAFAACIANQLPV